jgi:hypothetical protein
VSEVGTFPALLERFQFRTDFARGQIHGR